MLKVIRLVFYTETLLLLRRSQEWLYPLVFFLIIIIFFPLAFRENATALQKWMPGGIWIAALLANLLAVETIFLKDQEEGYLEQIILGELPLPLFIPLDIIHAVPSNEATRNV